MGTLSANEKQLLSFDDITDNVLIIKVNRSYHPGMSKQEKYDVTRGIWKINPEKADRVKYVLSVYYGEVIEVYVPLSWYKAGETLSLTRDIDKKDKTSPDGRYEFKGSIAPEEARSRYIGKSVKALFKRGEMSPCKFIFLGEPIPSRRTGTLNKKQGGMHHTSRTIPTQLRYKVLKRDNFKCRSCGALPAKDPSVELQVDHITPWSKGGESVIDNLQTLCQNCNYGKNDML